MENRRDFFSTAPVVWNIIIINVLCLIATTVLRSRSGIELNDTLGLHFVLSEKFRVYQFFTYMFMHAGVEHILFNMFAVYMFGRLFEMFWGGKKFLFYYLVAGLGAAIVQQTVWYIDYCSIASHIADMPAVMSHISTEGAKAPYRRGVGGCVWHTACFRLYVPQREAVYVLPACTYTGTSICHRIRSDRAFCRCCQLLVGQRGTFRPSRRIAVWVGIAADMEKTRKIIHQRFLARYE